MAARKPLKSPPHCAAYAGTASSGMMMSKTNSLAMDRPALPGAISTRRLPGAIHQSAGTPIFLRMACYSKRSNAAAKTSRCFTLVADVALCPTVSKEKDDDIEARAQEMAEERIRPPPPDHAPRGLKAIEALAED
jgi:hypothetical protein